VRTGVVAGEIALASAHDDEIEAFELEHAALAVADLAGARFSTAGGDSIDGSFGDFYLRAVSDIANSAASASGRYEDQSTLQSLVRQRRDSVSGVSLDEEMTDLIKFQRAFDASARVMRVLDEMLDTVVNGLVR